MKFYDIDEEKIKFYMENPEDIYTRIVIVTLLEKLWYRYLERTDIDHIKRKEILNIIKKIKEDILPISNMSIDTLMELKKLSEESIKDGQRVAIPNV